MELSENFNENIDVLMQQYTTINNRALSPAKISSLKIDEK